MGRPPIPRPTERSLLREGGAMPAGPTSTSARELIPEGAALDELRTLAAGCRGCDLWERGTQTVFGAGPANARILLIGEQPGSVEDLTGRPFVGPAGKVLDRALEAVGLDRHEAYVTNIVKHFKWEPRGKRRIHTKPNAAEMAACRPWLDAEIERVRPMVIVCLGATAARALLGEDFRVSRDRGKFVPSPLAPYVMATVHPSSLLRITDPESRQHALSQFVSDLARVSEVLRRSDREEPSATP